MVEGEVCRCSAHADVCPETPARPLRSRRLCSGAQSAVRCRRSSAGSNRRTFWRSSVLLCRGQNQASWRPRIRGMAIALISARRCARIRLPPLRYGPSGAYACCNHDSGETLVGAVPACSEPAAAGRAGTGPLRYYHNFGSGGASQIRYGMRW